MPKKTTSAQATDDRSASSLEQVLQFFDPRKPLFDANDLRHWFVDRPYSPRESLRILLTTRDEPQKILFVGHRGNGKSTEIAKLCEELGSGFLPVMFHALDATGRTNLEYEDLMLAIATRTIRQCIDSRLAPKPLIEPVGERWQQFRGWWRQMIAGTGISSSETEISLGAELAGSLAKVEVGVKQSTETREALKLQVNRQMPELLSYLNWVIGEAESRSGKKLLLVVEGLDKVDLGAARGIFRDHSPTITAPKAHMIFTFPLALRHSEEFYTIRAAFSNTQFLPNFCINLPHCADADTTGRKNLRQLVLARAPETFFENEALDDLVLLSGGLPMILVELVQSAALFAIGRKSARIEKADVARAAREARHNLFAPLTQAEREVLRARHADRAFNNDPIEQRLIYMGSLVEYPNDVQWCDAHPLLWPVLEG